MHLTCFFYTLLSLVLIRTAFATSVGKLAQYEISDTTVGTGALRPGIGTYEGLYYNSWISAGASGVAGAPVPVILTNLKPRSGKGRITHGAPEFLTNGTAYIEIPPDGLYKSFTPLDFYFGCVARTTVPGANPAISCTVTVKGYKKGNPTPIVAPPFKFEAPLNPLEDVQMVKADLPSTFKTQKLAKITLEQDLGVAKSIQLDDFSYKLNT